MAQTTGLAAGAAWKIAQSVMSILLTAVTGMAGWIVSSLADTNKLVAELNVRIAKIEANKKEIAEEEPPPPDEPPFEPDPEYDAIGRVKFLKAMDDYRNINSDIYAGVLMDNDLEDMNAVKPGDEQVILGFMDQAFEV